MQDMIHHHAQAVAMAALVAERTNTQAVTDVAGLSYNFYVFAALNLAGAILVAPVKVKGAGVYMGDMHAAQGDGEIAGHTMDVAGSVTLQVEVLKDWPIDGPVLFPLLEDLPPLARPFSAAERAKAKGGSETVLIVGGGPTGLEAALALGKRGYQVTLAEDVEAAQAALARLAGALPAFGIVAAVLGVVNTMGSVGQPPSVLGGMIGSALVGTFLGILLAYGVVEPLGGLVEQKTEDAAKELQCIKSTLLASMQGYNPATAIEFGRKVLFSDVRPSFTELEGHVKGKK